MILPNEKNSFHAQHSAIGAHSSFTLGMHGAPGGLALEKGQPADGAVYVVDYYYYDYYYEYY